MHTAKRQRANSETSGKQNQQKAKPVESKQQNQMFVQIGAKRIRIIARHAGQRLEAGIVLMDLGVREFGSERREGRVWEVSEWR